MVSRMLTRALWSTLTEGLPALTCTRLKGSIAEVMAARLPARKKRSAVSVATRTGASA